MPNTTNSLRTKISNDLRDAMKSRDQIAVTTLRSLITVLDNASAVPITSEHVPVFGRSNDVPRKILTDIEYQTLLRMEFSARDAAVVEFERLELHEQAERTRVELSIIARYVSA